MNEMHGKKPSETTARPADEPHIPSLNTRLAQLLYRTSWFRFFLAILSAVLLILSFPPFNYGILAWVALVPLLVATLSTPSLKLATGLGAITGVIFYSISLHFFWPVFGLMGLLLGNIMTVFLALFTASLWIMADRFALKKTLIITPIFWTALEYFRAECYFLKFSWLSLGYSQHNHLTLIQICDVFGVYGLSFIIVITNALLAWFVLEKLRRKKLTLWSPIVALVIFSVVLLYGLVKLSYVGLMEKTSRNQIDVAVFQEELTTDALDHYIEKTNQITRGKKPLMAVWPEVCVKNALSNPQNRARLEKLTREKNIYLVLGSEEEPERHVYQNLVLMFGPKGKLPGEYHKRVPVQFVETAFIRAGKEVGVFQSDFGPVGIMTCYEAGYSNLGRDTVKAGAKILVIPTNEVRNWGRIEHELHASIVPYRAVETRRPIARSASVGVSMVVDPYGRIQSKLDFLQTGVIRTTITPRRYQTIYVRYGYLLPIFCLIFYLGLMLGHLIVPLLIEAYHNA